MVFSTISFVVHPSDLPFVPSEGAKRGKDCTEILEEVYRVALRPEPVVAPILCATADLCVLFFPFSFAPRLVPLLLVAPAWGNYVSLCIYGLHSYGKNGGVQSVSSNAFRFREKVCQLFVEFRFPSLLSTVELSLRSYQRLSIMFVFLASVRSLTWRTPF